jgi:diguanylate cyclase (GGDEF)-like protein
MIICPESNAGNAEILANNIRKKIEQFEFPKADKVTSSFGVTQHDQNDNSPDTFKRVDDALYKAKNAGRNKVVVENVNDSA